MFATFPLLERLARRSAARLSGGEQQALAIGPGPHGQPAAPAARRGVARPGARGRQQLYAALPTIRGAGTTLLLVEQDINQALAAADRVYCLLEGRVVLEGAPAELARERITAAYFGVARRHRVGRGVTP